MTGLPPTTLTQAIDFYQKVKSLQGAALAMTDPLEREEWLGILMSMMVVMGDKLVEQQNAILDVTETCENLELALRAYVNSELERQMAETPDKDLVAEASADPELTGLYWQGTSADYFDNAEIINHELAQDISKMAKQRDEDRRSHPTAIDAPSREIEPENDPE